MRKLTALLLCVVSLYAEYTIIPDQTTLKIATPSLAHQEIARIKLANGLEAVIVSNPELKQSAVNLVVLSGSLQDPEDHEGLAHFLEHMLFLGTDEFPTEMEFGRFLSEHSGEMNAYTSTDYTSYQFSIPPSGLPEALQRFSSFFKQPLLSVSGVSRELNAIDQEFAKGFNSENKMAFQVLKELISKEHPAHLFNSGNSLSLANSSPEDLRAWFNSHYSADRMRLYLLSPLPLKELTELVDKNFSTIPIRNVEPLNLTKPLFEPSVLGTETLIALPKDRYEIDLVWEIPYTMPFTLDNQPEELLAYVFENKGPGSLLSYLKTQGFAEDISSGSLAFASNARLFEVDIILTEKGFRNKEKVIESVFQTMALLRKQPYPQTLYNELSELKTQQYQFQQYDTPFDWARKQGDWLAKEGPSTYPELSNGVGKFDPASIEKLLALLTPEKALYFVYAPEKTFGRKLEKVEKWMKVPYEVKKIDPALFTAWQNTPLQPAITLNQTNPFIAKDPKVTGFLSKKADYPSLTPPLKLLEQPGVLFYFAKDELYELPRTFLRMELQSPILQEGKARKAALAELYIKALEKDLSELIYQAKTADIEIKFELVMGGIQISVEGFTEGVLKLYPKLLEAVIKAEFSEEEFAAAKEALQREYTNSLLDMPLKQSFDYLKGAVLKGYSTNAQKKNALKPIELNTLETFSSDLFKKTFIKGFVMGSLSQDQAQEMANRIDQTLHEGSKKTAAPFYPEVFPLNPCKGPCKLTIQSEAQGNALLLIMQDTPYSPQERNCNQLLTTAMWEAFFTELRTKQQTGYLVGCDSVDLYRNLYAYFAIQSTKYLPEELLWRSERFIEEYLQKIPHEEIPPERFESLKAGMQTKLTEPPGSLSLYGELLYKLAFDLQDFNWLNKRLQLLQDLDYKSFLSSAEKILGRQNNQRLAIMILDSDAKDLLQYTSVASPTALLKERENKVQKRKGNVK